MSYKIGDEVICRLNENDYSQIHLNEVKLQIIAFGCGYENDLMLCYVAPYTTVRSSFKLTSYHLSYYEFNPKFLNEQGTFVRFREVIKHMPAITGELCQKCLNFIPWASWNSEDVQWCRSCKQNPYI
jgi:hypothetical protein